MELISRSGGFRKVSIYPETETVILTRLQIFAKFLFKGSCGHQEYETKRRTLELRTCMLTITH